MNLYLILLAGIVLGSQIAKMIWELTRSRLAFAWMVCLSIGGMMGLWLLVMAFYLPRYCQICN